MKRILKVLGYTTLIIIGLITALVFWLEGNSNEAGLANAKEAVKQSYNLILADNYEGAYKSAQEAQSINTDDDYNKPEVLVSEIPKLYDKEYQDSVLYFFSDVDVQSKESIVKLGPYSVDDTINTKLIEIFLKRKDDRAAIYAAKDLQRKLEYERRMEMVAELDESAKNMRLSKTVDIRNAFLDSGFDIKVSVRDKDYEHLYLEYPLFNDVWHRRFNKDGLLTSFKQMGFKKITLTDGYDYTRVVKHD